jgi:hypothetical protein
LFVFLLGDAQGGIDDRVGKVLWNGRFSIGDWGSKRERCLGDAGNMIGSV